jgi:hypothetical protein
MNFDPGPAGKKAIALEKLTRFYPCSGSSKLLISFDFSFDLTYPG